MIRFLRLVLILSTVTSFSPAEAARAGGVSAADYASIQEALDKNPGVMIFVPAGDYVTTAAVRIERDRSGLYGPGRIIQNNPGEPILRIEKGAGIQIRDLTLTRGEGRKETREEGLLATGCENLRLDGLQVIDNQTRGGAITLRECRNAVVNDCLIENYMRVTTEDRTGDWKGGYEFNCIDGTGLRVFESTGTLLQANRIIENRLKPTQEMKEKYELGKFVKKESKRGAFISKELWDSNYMPVWHQGSGLIVASGSDFTRVLGNHVENAAQGIDIHSDHITIANNVVTNSFMGMKAMHGARNVLIIGNQFSKNALWSIGLMPGKNSQPAGVNAPANVDGGSIVANNIISDFGYGDAYWMWGGPGKDCYPMRFTEGQEEDDPPLHDVVVAGNVVYDSGRDQILVDGKPTLAPPRYKYAVFVGEGKESDMERGYLAAPSGIHFSNNMFHPGEAGVSNIELKP